MTVPTQILVVEDDVHIAKLISVLLQDAGYVVMAVGTAKAALEVLASQQPDLVILDWMLPDMAGDRVCQAIKLRENRSYLPVLMLTARATVADRIAGLDAGADDYVTKPFHNDELLARARALLRIRKTELERSEALQALGHQHEELKAAYEQLRSAQAQLVQASKMAALGELVAGVAHELNNPLAIILGNAELLPEFENEDDRRAIQQIIAATQRGRRVVQSLVTFARHDKVEFDWHKPADMVERVLDLRRTSFRTSDIQLRVVYDPDVPQLWVDGPQVQQALLSLVINAEQALYNRAGALIAIDVYMAGLPLAAPGVLPEHSRSPRAEGAQPMVVIDIADNGPGLAEHVHARLFEPFVTTRPVGQGIGMGLATAYAIVRQHNGQLLVSSVPNHGVTFRIALPVQAQPAEPEPPTAAPRVVLTKRVLVIDDEPAIVELVARLLSRSGYQVASALSAAKGLELLQQSSFDLILCDIRMPDMDGQSFYAALKRDIPSAAARMVVMTGDTSNLQTDAFLREYNLPVLRKPFTRQELLQMIGRAAALAPSTL